MHILHPQHGPRPSGFAMQGAPLGQFFFEVLMPVVLPAPANQKVRPLERAVLPDRRGTALPRAASGAREGVPRRAPRTGIRCVSVNLPPPSPHQVCVLDTMQPLTGIRRDDGDDLRRRYRESSPSLPIYMQRVHWAANSALIPLAKFPISRKTAVPGSVGRLAPGTSAKVVKADGTLAGVGETGELLVHGPQIVRGYYRNPKA